ncbi:hypothetical protein [Stenotrophomonas pavanii]|uniref:hypothetical protein n=1 Tax=Stenotrophomonas pavanii TaxID=487698 RepID=UPI0039C5F153
MPVELSQWLPQAIRATAFFAPIADGELRAEPELDKVYTDVEVESKEIRKPLGETQQLGSLGVGKISVATAPGRADFVWKVEDDEPPLQSQSLGDLRSALAIFLEPVCDWLAHQPDVNRVAVGVHALLPSSSRDEAYGHMNDLLPEVTLDPSSSGEAIFQINRWLDCEVEGEQMRCNRISRWASIYNSVNQFNMVGGIPHPGRKISETYAVSSQLDFNSSAERIHPLNASDAVGLIRILANEATETLVNGKISK